jgi:hypothetical protein
VETKQRCKRFPSTPQEVLNRFDEVKRAAGVNVYRTKVREMDEGELKRVIPRLFYEGLLLSVDELNTWLRTQDPKKRKVAATVFIDKLCDANFIKNLNLLASALDEGKKGKPEKPKAEWGK